MARRNAWILLGLVALRCALLAVQLERLPANVEGHWVANDAVRFHAIATAPGQAGKDFEVEFPPLTVALLDAGAGSDPRATAVRLAWLQFGFDLAVVGAMTWGWGVRSAVAYLLISLPLLPFIYFRLDLLSVALAIWAMALVARQAPLAGGLVLSAAVFAKFWPAVLAVGLAAQRRWRALAAFAGATVMGVTVWVGFAGPDALGQVATFRGSQGWQVESAVGSILLRFSDRPVVWEGDANRIGAAAGARPLLTLVLVVGFIGIGLLAHRRGVPDIGVVSLASVTLLLLAAPILSWQYLVWLAPWAALAWIEGERVPALVATAAIVLTAPLVPLGVELTERQPLATNVLMLRNLTLAGLLIVCVAALSLRSAPRWETGSRESEPAGN